MPEWFHSKLAQNKPQNSFKFQVKWKMCAGNFGWYEWFAGLAEKLIFFAKIIKTDHCAPPLWAVFIF